MPITGDRTAQFAQPTSNSDRPRHHHGQPRCNRWIVLL